MRKGFHKEYAAAYSKIISNQTQPRLRHVYIDAFAGARVHLTKGTGEFVLGSPINALNLTPPFAEYHFIDLNSLKIENLESIAGQRSDVFTYHGDCNRVLIDKVFPRAKWEDYRRALCVLDPYGLHLDWTVIKKAGSMKSVEIFLNFPVADMNRNVLWKNPENVGPDQIERMNRFWGDESWREKGYRPSPQRSLFDTYEIEEKESNDAIAAAFRDHLISVAGFKHVPAPIAMRNSMNAIVYYLFFATNNLVAENIVRDIFRKYEGRRG